MNRILYLLALGLAFAVSPAVAQQVDSPLHNAAADSAESSGREQRASNCLQYTGSRIVSSRAVRARKNTSARVDECAPMLGRSYSRDDIDSTGAVDLGEALRRLDPAIR